MRATRLTVADPVPAPGAIALLPLDGDGDGVVFRLDAGPEAAGEPFETTNVTRGPWTGPARFAVYADWLVAADGDPAGFEASRLALFGLRREHIACFHTDYLFRRSDDPRRYTVLGLYGEEEGLRLCREHPAIAAWARQNPPATWGARDESGLRFFRIAG